MLKFFSTSWALVEKLGHEGPWPLPVPYWLHHCLKTCLLVDDGDPLYWVSFGVFVYLEFEDSVLGFSFGGFCLAGPGRHLKICF